MNFFRPAFFLGLVLGGVLTLFPLQTFAHSMSPTLLEINEEESGLYQLSIRQPLKLAKKQLIAPLFPPHCHRVGVDKESYFTLYRRIDFRLDCGELGLSRQKISLPSLKARGFPVVLKFRHLGGANITAVLNARSSEIVIPDEPALLDVFSDYFILGGEHLLSGVDHLLFLAALVLLLQRFKALVAVITAFTLGHALSVVLVTLGIFTIASALVEIFIALSIVYLCLDIYFKEQHQRRLRQTALLCSVFGVLHGMGFASALNIADLSQGDKALALLAFNLGIEAVQLLVVTVSAVLLFILFRWCSVPERRVLKPAAMLIGAAGGFWFWERLFVALGQVQLI